MNEFVAFGNPGTFIESLDPRFLVLKERLGGMLVSILSAMICGIVALF